MWRSISHRASVIAVVAVVGLAGCGDDEQTTSAGAQVPTSGVSTTATTVPAATTVAPTTAAAQRCANVSFSSNAEDIASDIRSTGLGCTEAEALVRKVGAQVSSPTGPSRVEADGFTCSRVSVRSGDHGPSLGTFDCTNGATKVVFVRALVG